MQEAIRRPGLPVIKPEPVAWRPAITPMFDRMPSCRVDGSKPTTGFASVSSMSCAQKEKGPLRGRMRAASQIC
ncbi:hypothetical protein WS67_02820 [Burkholderia singularis]|uniref:Uncharacterized protein n=1 Tax=Burkholderia singularis TaxID=1503053 RepID=A0A124P7U4_9BURK|nr:hypothetical protein WS67_02820 [Burkholderia singularis]